MATHTITIYATNANPLPLTITDDEGNRATTEAEDALLTTDFRNGDTVRFEISTEDGCEIANIEDIIVTNLTDGNGNSYNLFQTGPKSAEDGTGAWTGLIGYPNAMIPPVQTFTSPAESYKIKFLMNDGTSHTEDPRIRIKQ